MKPNRRWRATAARPADAMQPQLVQSGAPPNWHGVIFVVRSAEIVAVVLANTHSSGDEGGFAYNLEKAFRQSQLREFQPQRHQIGDDALAIGGPEALLLRDLSDLRRVEAAPDFLDFRSLRPETEKLLDVAGPLDLLTRHRAMNGDAMTFDVLEDPIVGGWRAPGVVLGLQAVDRDDD